MSLFRVSADTKLDEIMAGIDEHGYCIVERLLPEAAIDAVNAEMAPYLEGADTGQYATLGTKTRRSGALIARSPASHRLIMDPLVLSVADRLLRRTATVVQLNLTQIICIDPGEKAQFLHRDEMAWDAYPHFPRDYHIELSTIWALDDFTEENGATRIVPGSHRSDRFADSYTPEETMAAEMSKGSVLVYSGKTVHGGGANRSAATRRACNIDYCVGWVRQEENQYLTVPIETARTLDPELRNLMGYQMGAAAIGYVRDYEDPIVALHPDMGPAPVKNDLFLASAERSEIARRALKKMAAK